MNLRSKSLLTRGKLIAVYNYITDLMEKDSNASIILFLQCKDLAKFVAESFSQLKIYFVRVNNSIYKRKRLLKNLKKLNSKDVRSVSGINLTEAPHAILLHPFFTDKGK